MIQLNNYILEKLKLDKNIKTKEFDEKFLFIIPFGDAYDFFKKDFIDALITSDNESNGFIIPIDYIKDNYKKWIDTYNYSYELYRIPSSYQDIEQFEDDYKDGTITPEDLEKIENDDLE